MLETRDLSPPPPPAKSMFCPSRKDRAEKRPCLHGGKHLPCTRTAWGKASAPTEWLGDLEQVASPL